MDMAAANLIEKEIMYWYFFRYFGKRFKDILDRYGANTTLQTLGETVSLEAMKKN
jgi:alanine-glyoxylate transaminase/serine-glyoxylate transaminase/serine-pyruvate transaminase